MGKLNPKRSTNLLFDLLLLFVAYTVPSGLGLTLIFIVLAEHCDGNMALVACVRSSDTVISALIIRARNHGFHHWTGWAASVCQVGLRLSLSLSLSARLTLRCSRQPQLRPGETRESSGQPSGSRPGRQSADSLHYGKLWGSRRTFFSLAAKSKLWRF